MNKATNIIDSLNSIQGTLGIVTIWAPFITHILDVENVTRKLGKLHYAYIEKKNLLSILQYHARDTFQMKI